MEEKRHQNLDQSVQDIFYCSRCKIKEAEITCAMCDPFKHFCSKCNEYVHSVPSKKFHVRRKMQDKLHESVNNKAVNDSKLKTSNSSNFKLSENFNKEKFSQVIKDKQIEIKKALENFEFNYSNNRFYNHNNENSNNINNYKNSDNDNVNFNINSDDKYRMNLNGNYEEVNQDNNNNNYKENYKHDNNFYNSSKEVETSNQDIERIDRGRIRENNNYGTYSLANNFDNPKNIERADRNNYSNNSLRGSYYVNEKGIGKSRDNSRRFYNFRRNNTNQDASLSKSPKTYVISNNDLNQNIQTGNNYINEIKVNQ